MGKIIDLTGQKFNRLTVIERDTNRKVKNRTYWICKCDCGNITSVDASKLKSGHTKSCGCFAKEKREEYIKSLTTHNKRHTKLFYVWGGMKARCYNPNNKAYKNYGGSNITICDEWLGKNGFQTFYDWSMANGYKEGLSIDRIDNTKGYSPDNCRWTDMKTQNNNRRNNTYISYKGEIKTLTEWCELLNLNYKNMKNRVTKNGIPFEYAITMPQFVRIMYKGKETDLRKVCSMESINYKKALYDVVVNGKTYEELTQTE